MSAPKSNYVKPQPPAGMRDFLPAAMLRRQYVIDTVADVFELHGYEPIQTPVMERRETLLGKYGEDAEKLLYFARHTKGEVDELALRYDLTVPLARLFAQYESELPLPFKRYQIAPVWRGDSPGRGRFREFYQCDADTVGIAGMEADAEAMSVVVGSLTNLKFDRFAVKINNRKLLTGIGQYAGLEGAALADLYRTIDKFDKISAEGVLKTLIGTGIAEDTASRIMSLIKSREASESESPTYESNAAVLNSLRAALENVPTALQGITELATLLTVAQAMKIPAQNIDIDLTMVRGLGYYTGSIFETVLLTDRPEERIGSVAGGGRYDDLIGLFRKESLPTVGISIGIERLITILEERNAYPESLSRTVVQALVTVFNAEMKASSLALVGALRQAGIKAELFMQDNKGVGKQIGYADKKGIPVVVIQGPDELAGGKVKIKRLSDQREVETGISDAADAVKSLLQTTVQT